MLKLVVKDLRVSALFLWLIVPVYAVLALGSALNLQAHFWLTIALAFGLMVLVPGIQWYQGSDIFVSTLPVDRTLLVKGRFASSAAALAACLAAGAYPGVVLGFAGSLVGRGWPVWLDSVTGCEFVLVGTLLIAVSHPVLSRWGFGSAVVAGTGTMVGLLATALAMAPLQTLDVRPASPLGLLLRLMEVKGGVLATVAISGLLAAGLLVASARLSIAWARERDI